MLKSKLCFLNSKDLTVVDIYNNNYVDFRKPTEYVINIIGIDEIFQPIRMYEIFQPIKMYKISQPIRIDLTFKPIRKL